MSIMPPAPDNNTAPREGDFDPGCPWCVGDIDGQWMELCDDHLRQWLRPALRRSPGGA